METEKWVCFEINVHKKYLIRNDSNSLCFKRDLFEHYKIFLSYFFSGGEGSQEGEGHGNKVRPTKSSKSSNFQINLYDTKRIDEKHQERIHYMHNQANAKFITSSNVVVISFLIVILNLVVRFWNFNSRAWRNNYCLKRLLAAVPAA